MSALLLSGLSTQNAYAQRNPTKEERKAAADAFNADYDNQWTLRWDDRRGSPRSMYGPKITHYDGTPTQIATAFFSDHKQMLGIRDVGQDLRLVKTNNSIHGGTRLIYKQYFRDIPLLNGGYLVAIGLPKKGKTTEYIPPGSSTPRDPFDPTQRYDLLRDKTNYTQSRDDWYIYFINGDYYPDIEVNTTPSLTASSAAQRAQDVGAASGLESVSASQLAVWVEETGEALTYRLVYKVEGVTASGASWDALIDAQTGAVIEHGARSSGVTPLREGEAMPEALDFYRAFQDKRRGRAPYAAASMGALTLAKGDIYKTNPIHSSVSDDESIGYVYLFGSGIKTLDGNYIKVTRGDGEDVATQTGSPPDFDYPTGDEHFDEVMAYAHAYNFRYWLYDMGMPYNKVPKVTITVHHSSIYGAAEVATKIRFMSGYSANGWLNPTKEGAIIAHEFTHLLTYQYNAGFTTNFFESEEAAMSESYSDYFGIAWRDQQGCSGSGCTTLGYYADASSGSQTPFARVIGSAAHFNDYGEEDFDDNGTSGSQYDNSYIFTGALWDFRDAAGWLADYMVLESLNNLSVSVDFLDGNDALYVAAGETYDGESCSSCPNYVCTYFSARGIIGSEECGSPKRGEGLQAENAVVEIPRAYVLYDNFPNPFNPATTISFELPEASQIVLVIYDVLGREVARLVEGTVEAGRHNVTWEAGHLPSGTYFYELTSGGFKEVRHMVLLK